VRHSTISRGARYGSTLRHSSRTRSTHVSLELSTFIKAEIQQWGKVIKASGARGLNAQIPTYDVVLVSLRFSANPSLLKLLYDPVRDWARMTRQKQHM
jgi:hypothetical protein